MELKDALNAKIYIGWAFVDEDGKKQKHNREVYEAIKHLATRHFVKSGYANSQYRVSLTSETQLNDMQKALIADGGDLCFGYRKDGDLFIVYTD